tara:strand:- start:2292 stop:3086 length:795 start_codon:yes stop_codon:yes gene_type:complete
MKILVCVKEVIDPEVPVNSIEIDQKNWKFSPKQGVSTVLNGFDENAVEAALRIKEQIPETEISVLSIGSDFSMDVIKKPLSMGCQNLYLVKDDELNQSDPFVTSTVLSRAINKIGDFDLILCGRHASDWDNAQVPVGIAELLNIECITLAKGIDVQDNEIAVDRVIPGGSETVKSVTPLLVTVSNEYGEPRYPNLRGIMAAGKIQPTTYTLSDLELSKDDLKSKNEIVDIFIPEKKSNCEFIEGEDEYDIGRNLAMKLRENNLI